jgi:hypothetical protein
MWTPSYKRRLLGPATILEPPRDGRQLDPVFVHDAFQRSMRAIRSIWS